MDEHGLDAAVLAVVAGKFELLEDVTDVGLDVAGADPEPFDDRAVGEALGRERENPTLAPGELVERLGVAAPTEEQVDSSRSTTSSPAATRSSALTSSSASMTRSLRRYSQPPSAPSTRRVDVELGAKGGVHGQHAQTTS